LNCLYRKFTLFRVHWGSCTYFAAPHCREHSMSNAWARCGNVVLKFDCCHAAAAVILMLALHAHLSIEVTIACVAGCKFALTHGCHHALKKVFGFYLIFVHTVSIVRRTHCLFNQIEGMRVQVAFVWPLGALKLVLPRVVSIAVSS
jgi:hypothetical protein